MTGYVIEKSLSVDNLFVMLLTFKAFRVKRDRQQRVLFWGEQDTTTTTNNNKSISPY